MKNFFQNLSRSITDANFYSEVPPKTTILQRYGYLYGLNLLIAFMTALILVSRFLTFYPQIGPKIEQVKPLISEFFPSDLTLTFKNNELSSSSKVPVHIDLNPAKTGLTTTSLVGDNYDYLLTIDPTVNSDSYPSSKSYILATKNTIILPDSNGKTQILFYSEIAKQIGEYSSFLQNSTVTRETIKSTIQSLDPQIQKLPKILLALVIVTAIVLPIVGSFFTVIFTLLYLLILTSIVFLVTKLFKKNQSFMGIYQMAPYAYTAPIILAFAFREWVNPYVQAIIFFLYMSYILHWSKEKSKKSL